MKSRQLAILLITVISAGLCVPMLIDFLNSTSHSEYYSHIPLIPVISGYLFFAGLDSIFLEVRYDVGPGLLTFTVGAGLYGIALYFKGQASQNDHAALVIFSTVMIWAGGFLALYGGKVFKRAAFPVAFLIFMVPLPDKAMEFVIHALRVGSTEVTNAIFFLTGIPYYRDGFTFDLGAVSIEVAPECSGIRSSLSLLITGVLAANLFLKRGWTRAMLIFTVLPIAIIKNGIRIAILSILGAYVDTKILTDSALHHKGGFVFFIIALVMFGAVLWYLRRSEHRLAEASGRAEISDVKAG
jgi:exosortase